MGLSICQSIIDAYGAGCGRTRMNREACSSLPCPAQKASSCIADAHDKPSLHFSLSLAASQEMAGTVHAKRFNVICIVASHLRDVVTCQTPWVAALRSSY
jgi:hypothetical protein